MLARLLEFLDRSGRVEEQASEIEDLRREIAKLRGQSESMRSSMRHCLTCEYREEINARR